MHNGNKSNSRMLKTMLIGRDDYLYVISEAKNMLVADDRNISEIA